MARLLARVVAASALLGALTVPVYLFIAAEMPKAPSRLAPPAIAARGLPSLPIGSYREAIPVLVYHDISDRPGRYIVSPRAFAEQMATLRHSGFHTISAAQLLAFLHGGGQLPSRPLLITFDDGLGSSWRVADPILAKYGLRAICFVISGQIGAHGYYYLQPAEVRAMIHSGRWDIEAHTRLAHQYVPSDGLGGFGPALTNRQWLARLRRLETPAEFEARITRDLDENIAELRGYGANPLLFAYPFSAARTPTNDARLIPILNRLVTERFKVSFVDANGGRFINRYDGTAPQQLPRIEVYHTTSAAALLERLSELAPVPPSLHNALAGHSPWSYEEAPTSGPRPVVRNGVLRLNCPPRHWVAAYWAPSRSELWQNYRVAVTMRRLASETSGTSETLLIGARDEDSYAVTLSAARLGILRLSPHGPAREFKQLTIRSAATHRLEVTLAGGELRVIVDHRELVALAISPATHGGIGLGGWRAYATSPMPAFTDLVVGSLA